MKVNKPLPKNLVLERDLKKFLEIYPRFFYKECYGKEFSILSGEIDICDTAENYLDSFDIEVLIQTNKYPLCIPIVREISKKIERTEEWHISTEGICCLDIDHKLVNQAKRGINLLDFYQNKIYPYFANTIYRMKFGKYSNGEYSHFFRGVQQFYMEKFNLSDGQIIVRILEIILNGKIPMRNDRPCICGEDKKFKYCHIEMVGFLKSLSRERLTSDLDGFKEILAKSA
jgi:hypothetical protein